MKKVCSACGQLLPLSAYNRRRRYSRDGRRAACRSCSNAKRREARKLRPPQQDLQRQRVRQRTHSAIKRGKLIRGACERCEAVDGVQAHHPSYEGEEAHLTVIWLCPGCHALEHGLRDWTKQIPIRFPRRKAQQFDLFGPSSEGGE